MSGFAGSSAKEITKPENSTILQSIFDGIPDGIIVIDRDYKVIMFNTAMQTFLKKTPEQMEGKDCFYICHQTDQVCHDCQAHNVFSRMFPPSRIRVCGTEHGKRQFEIWNFPIKSNNGEVSYMIEYMKDITDKQEIEKELAKSRRLAIVGELAARTSHEIRNPLNAMEGAAHYLLSEYKEDEKIQKYLGLIREQILRLNNVTTNLLTISKPRLSVGEKEFITQTLLKSVEIAEYTARDRKIEISLFLDEYMPKIHFDPTAMQEVFINVLKNACDAIEQEGRIEITGNVRERKGEEFLEIWVMDDGSGIPRNASEKVFDSFYTTKTDGTGLGLAIVKDIMKSHGGYVYLEDKPGGGTCVILGLPT